MKGDDKAFYRIKLLDSTKFQIQSAVVPIFIEEILIGRSENSNIQFDDHWTMVSRNHLKVTFKNKRIFIEPLHSSDNTTFINGKHLSTQVEIKSKTLIQCAKDGPRFEIIPIKSIRFNLNLFLNILIVVSSLILVWQIINIVLK